MEVYIVLPAVPGLVLVGEPGVEWDRLLQVHGSVKGGHFALLQNTINSARRGWRDVLARIAKPDSRSH